MELKTEYTQRGFGIIKFSDGNGEQCSLQISSAWRDEAMLWFGCQSDEPVKQLIPGEGWKAWKSPEGYDTVVIDRMHLSQSQVRELLPILLYFADTGELPPPSET